MTDAKKPGKLTGTKRAVKATATKKATKKAPASTVSAKVEEPVLRDETPTEAEIAEMEAMQEVLDAAEPESKPVEEPITKSEVDAVHSSAPEVSGRAGRVLVDRQFTKAGKLTDSDTVQDNLEVRTFLAAPAGVSVGYGATINLGDYESAKVNVQVSVPCYTEELDEAILFASGIAEKRVRREVAEIKGEELPEEEEVPEEEQVIPEDVEATEDAPVEDDAGEDDDDVIDEPRPAGVTEADFNLDDDDEEEEEDDDTEIEGFDEFDDLPEID